MKTMLMMTVILTACSMDNVQTSTAQQDFQTCCDPFQDPECTNPCGGGTGGTSACDSAPSGCYTHPCTSDTDCHSPCDSDNAFCEIGTCFWIVPTVCVP